MTPVTPAHTQQESQDFTWDGLADYRTTGPFLSVSQDYRTFWAPRDTRIHELICALLTSAHHSIVANHFGYDDDEADTIIRGKMASEHVYVQMSLDKTQAGGVHEKAILAKWPTDAIGTSIAIGQSIHHAISHLKVTIVDGLYTISGSTNWSMSGEKLQDNQITISRDPGFAAEARAVLDINHDAMLAAMRGTVKKKP